ncbi:proton-conducting transporter membrane subunit [Archangium sp.]|uniref:proton-conducting transporter transmembrane domain-containing protein n=1 Tax=Archangium sp. TaxID=1872627 RepID=UPI002D5F8A84|nr:proton-conducting transporter membrane subunit [Archangium sp.]HYO59844.1 proton-conducting transporter membrane subunit [Archangium sp.]
MQGLASVHSMGLLAAASALGVAFLVEPARMVEVATPPLFVTHGYEWRAVLLVDRLSVTYLLLVALIYPVIVRFSLPLFHREEGSRRYWFLVTLLAFALTAVSLAGNVDVLYLGWELVGVASVMLISFFRRNLRSTQNSLRALIYYRLCDLGILGAAMWIHHAFPSSEFSHFAEDTGVPTAAWVAFALFFGTLAKSAQLPMSPWLHRAMEGPSTSSAIFYGALSIHLGPLLLLRTSSLWMPHTPVRAAMAGIGLATALFATLVGHTRPDAKTSLAYATMAQLGLMYVEIAAGPARPGQRARGRRPGSPPALPRDGLALRRAPRGPRILRGGPALPRASRALHRGDGRVLVRHGAQRGRVLPGVRGPLLRAHAAGAPGQGRHRGDTPLARDAADRGHGAGHPRWLRANTVHLSRSLEVLVTNRAECALIITQLLDSGLHLARQRARAAELHRRTLASRILGVDRKTLYRKLGRRYGGAEEKEEKV